jgi:hypothetical protein
VDFIGIYWRENGLNSVSSSLLCRSGVAEKSGEGEVNVWPRRKKLQILPKKPTAELRIKKLSHCAQAWKRQPNTNITLWNLTRYRLVLRTIAQAVSHRNDPLCICIHNTLSMRMRDTHVIIRHLEYDGQQSGAHTWPVLSRHGPTQGSFSVVGEGVKEKEMGSLGGCWTGWKSL